MNNAATPRTESKVTVAIVIAIASLALCAAACGLIILTGALRFSPPPSARPFTFEDLFPTDLGLPYPWSHADSPPSAACRAAPLGSHCRSLRALYTSYPYMEFPGGGAGLEIHQYADADAAERDFTRLERRWFSYNDFGTPWIIPDDFPPISLHADHYTIGCHTHGYDESCQLLARYSEFILDLDIRRSSLFESGPVDLLSYEDVVTAFLGIDTHVSQL